MGRFFKGQNYLKDENGMQKTLIAFFKEKGIRFEICEKFLEFEYKDQIYRAVFELGENYPCCGLFVGISDMSYVSLDASAKSVVINRYNQGYDEGVRLTAQDRCISLESQFYFSDKQMMLDLFTSHLDEMHATCLDFVDKFVHGELTKGMGERRPVGFLSPLYNN